MVNHFRKQLSLILFIGTSLLISCAEVPDKNGHHYEYFNLNSIAKTDIDMVMDAHAEQTFEQLKILAIKLYKRNPDQWKKSGLPSLDSAIKRIFTTPFPKINGKTSTDSIRLAFDEKYKGDRVYALIAGMGSMLTLSYNGKKDFYILDSLDAQKIYNSARNIELASWLLRSRKHSNGQPFLLSYSLTANSPNQSFERVFGKMIGQQDTLAKIVASKTHRTIKNVVQSAAKFVFLPV